MCVCVRMRACVHLGVHVGNNRAFIIACERI